MKQKYETHNPVKASLKSMKYLIVFQLQNVLTYDAVRMVAKALDDISATADTLHIDQIDCRQPTSWAEGEKLMSYLQRVRPLKHGRCRAGGWGGRGWG